MNISRFNLGLLISVLLGMSACGVRTEGPGVFVSDTDSLQQAILRAQPGDEIIMKNGVWSNVKIQFSAQGTAEKPITLRAETAGMVTLEGRSDLKLAGEYLIVQGLYFRNGSTPSNTVIQFKIDDDHFAYHSRVTQCVIEDFSQPDRYNPDHWIEFWGRYNQLDHCYLAGKSNQGPTVRVFLTGNEHVLNYHRITNNHFGPRPRKGGPKAETMQIGDSFTSMTPAYVTVANNFFERCNGEVEIISSKSNFNEFRNNVFYECEGSLVMRHGNYCTVDGNIFIGDPNSRFNGGIRVINTGHWITNNYFYQLKGDEFRSPLAIMNGIPKSPLNRYNQVTDAVVAYNTWVDCKTPWQFSVGANMDRGDVLPVTEIRSARPIRTLLANNLIYNHRSDEQPIRTYDKVDGIRFENNILDNQGQSTDLFPGIESRSVTMDSLTAWLFAPSRTALADLGAVYPGFGFEEIKTDLFGNSRDGENNIGAILVEGQLKQTAFDMASYGPAWYSDSKPVLSPEIISVSSKGRELEIKLAAAKPGDIIELEPGNYKLEAPLVIDKRITLRSADPAAMARLTYAGPANSAAFEMHPRGSLLLKQVTLTGSGNQQAFASLKQNMTFNYGLQVEGSRIKGFKNILKSYKGSFADTISFSGSRFENCENGIDLAAETDDKGDYNAEFLTIENCEFHDIDKDVVNYYRGGYDESTIGGNLRVDNCLFEKCGYRDESRILIKSRGIINVDITGNRFRNNKVELVALLWGEKANHHAGNEFFKSGQIRVDQYLKQKLVY